MVFLVMVTESVQQKDSTHSMTGPQTMTSNSNNYELSSIPRLEIQVFVFEVS